MWVMFGRRQHVGPLRLTRVNHARRRWSPTWRRMGDDNLRRARPAQGHANCGGAESSGATLMTSSGDGRRGYFIGGWMAWAHCAPGVSLQAEGDRALDLWLHSVGITTMAERSPITRESRRGGCHCSRCMRKFREWKVGRRTWRRGVTTHRIQQRSVRLYLVRNVNFMLHFDSNKEVGRALAQCG